MKVYKVQMTNKALSDMEKIYYYILNAFKSPETAMHQYKRIAEVIKSLNVFPERVKIMNTGVEKTIGLRQVRIDNYSIFFVVEDDRVIVTRVIYSASDIEKRLADNL